MKKKIYFQTSIVLYIVLSLLIAMLVGAIYVVIEFFTVRIYDVPPSEYMITTATMISIVLLGYYIIKGVRNVIILNIMKYVYHNIWGERKIQYETYIEYSMIQIYL